MSITYDIEVGTFDQKSWTEIIHKFRDASIYQSLPYGSVRWGIDKLNHIILKQNGYIVSAAQARIVSLPVLKGGIVYIPWGPMWKIKDSEENPAIFHQMIQSLQEEYVIKRGFMLRVVPNIFTNDQNGIHSKFIESGFTKVSSVNPYRTLLVDLSPSLETLRKGLNQKWRNQLNRSEKNNLEIIEGTDLKLYNIFLEIYNEMYDRKKFVEYVSVDEFKQIQENLPDIHKMKIIICRHEGKPVSGIVCSAIGDTGIYLLGATNDHGMKLKGSYLLQWKMIEYLNLNGYRWYDLGGINPINNPGTYHFKAGLSGKNGEDIQHIGQYDASGNFIISLVIKSGDLLRRYYRISKGKINKIIKH